MIIQIPMTDTFIVEGEVVLVKLDIPLPDAHPRIVDRYTGSPFCSIGPAAARHPEHYIACWEILNGQLYLAELLSSQLRLRDYEAIRAHWYTGTISVGLGDVIGSQHMVALYEREITVQLRKGRVITCRSRGKPADICVDEQGITVGRPVEGVQI